jgi:hypothetical protein
MGCEYRGSDFIFTERFVQPLTPCRISYVSRRFVPRLVEHFQLEGAIFSLMDWPTGFAEYFSAGTRLGMKDTDRGIATTTRTYRRSPAFLR